MTGPAPAVPNAGEPANLAAALLERARRHPDRPALIESRLRRRLVTFGELAARVSRLGELLVDRGLEPGDRTLLFVPMSVDLYVSLLGVLHAGGVAVFVDAWAGRRRLEQAVAAASPAAFIGTPRAHLLRLVSPSLRSIPVRLRAGGPFAAVGRTVAPDPADGRASPVEVDPESPALVTFTTGTTGRPKAAARSHAFLWAQHRVLARHLGLTESDVDMPTLPVFVLNNLALGVTTVLPAFDPRRPAEVDPGAILGQMREEGVTTVSGSPAFFTRLCSRPPIPVRALFTGGAPVFPALAERLIAATEGEVRVLYGSTEAEPIAGIEAGALVAASREADALGVCAGAPVPEIEWKVIRPVDGPVGLGPDGWSGLEVDPGATGELVVTGPHVLAGYLGDPEAEAAAKIRDGDRVWHRTGDGVRFDGDRLWLMGRVSQRVERPDGTWWSMAAEARAMAVAGVRHAAYVGMPGPVGGEGGVGEEAVLCVELGTGARWSAELEARLRSVLDPIPVDEIRVLPTIPRDPRHASKTDLGALRQLLTP